MDRETYDLLTPRERDCLRLVARERDSGEIARELSLSTGTVDNYVKTARAKLGGVTRFAAARALRAYEETLTAPPPAPLPSQDPPPKDDDPVGFTTHPMQADPPSAAGSHSQMREERATFEFVPPVTQLASGRRRRNGFSSTERLAIMVALFALLAIGSFAALAIPLLLQLLPAFHQR